jgi:hypothetical protein
MDVPPEEIELRELPDVRMPLLQSELLRRSMVKHSETCDRCAHCHRTLLAGEQIFVCDDDRIVCELCMGLEPDVPREPQLVHGPELGHTINIVDKRSHDSGAGVVRRRRSSRAAHRAPRD